MASDSPRVLMDTCALLAIIKSEPGTERLLGLLEMLDRDEAQLVESSLILCEVYKKSGAADAKTRQLEDTKLAGILARLKSRDVELLDVTAPIAERAAEYRALYRLRSADAIHLATAVLNKCVWFVTLDTDYPAIGPLHIYNRQQICDPSVPLPWDVEVQDSLFSEMDNVFELKPKAQ